MTNILHNIEKAIAVILDGASHPTPELIAKEIRDEVARQITDLEGQVTALQAQIANAPATAEAELTALRDQVTALNNANDELARRVAELEAECDAAVEGNQTPEPQPVDSNGADIPAPDSPADPDQASLPV